MESTGIQRLFYLSWTVIKLNLLFVLFSLAGGIILVLVQHSNDD